MEGFMFLFWTGAILFGIFQILLMFKLWDMCNDINVIKEHLVSTSSDEIAEITKQEETKEVKEKITQKETSSVIVKITKFVIGLSLLMLIIISFISK